MTHKIKNKFISTVKFHWDITTFTHLNVASVKCQRRAPATDVIWSAPSKIVLSWHSTETVIGP